MTDQITHKVPFEALVQNKPKEYSTISEIDFVIRRFEVSRHYSAKLIGNKSMSEKHEKVVNTDNRFLAFAPVFQEESVMAVANRYRNNEITPLPSTKDEVTSIQKLFARQNIEPRIFTYKNATKMNFLKSYNRFNYIHLATHSVPNAEYAGQSYIQFFYDKKSEGRLYSDEIYGLNVDADLLVLSSCSSGIGKVIKGEGMMGLSRAFLLAGANNILCSLWNVKDKDTSDFMIKFYHYLLNERMSYSQALRATKIHFINKGKKIRNWSVFTLVSKN